MEALTRAGRIDEGTVDPLADRSVERLLVRAEPEVDTDGDEATARERKAPELDEVLLRADHELRPVSGLGDPLPVVVRVEMVIGVLEDLDRARLEISQELVERVRLRDGADRDDAATQELGEG